MAQALQDEETRQLSEPTIAARAERTVTSLSSKPARPQRDDQEEFPVQMDVQVEGSRAHRLDALSTKSHDKAALGRTIGSLDLVPLPARDEDPPAMVIDVRDSSARAWSEMIANQRGRGQQPALTTRGQAPLTAVASSLAPAQPTLPPSVFDEYALPSSLPSAAKPPQRAPPSVRPSTTPASVPVTASGAAADKAFPAADRARVAVQETFRTLGKSQPAATAAVVETNTHGLQGVKPAKSEPTVAQARPSVPAMHTARDAAVSEAHADDSKADDEAFARALQDEEDLAFLRESERKDAEDKWQTTDNSRKRRNKTKAAVSPMTLSSAQAAQVAAAAQLAAGGAPSTPQTGAKASPRIASTGKRVSFTLPNKVFPSSPESSTLDLSLPPAPAPRAGRPAATPTKRRGGKDKGNDERTASVKDEASGCVRASWKVKAKKLLTAFVLCVVVVLLALMLCVLL
jgi:hypothetical protein